MFKNKIMFAETRRKRFAFIALLFGLPILYLLKTNTSGIEKQRNINNENFNPLFWNQGISNEVFHFALVKSYIADVVRTHNVAAVVGVLDGIEAYWLAKTGFKVFAFEPVKEFADVLHRKFKKHNMTNITIVNKAVSNISQKVAQISYGESGNTAETIRIDDLVSESIDVLSIDIQGNEYDALLGATNLLEHGKIVSLWIEIKACNEKVPLLLNKLLANDYILYDFVPWGQTKNNERKTSVFHWHRDNSNSVLFRPETINNYLNWMCSIKPHFWYLQTDVLAIHRASVTKEVELRFNHLLHDVFLEGMQKKWVDKGYVHYF